MEQHRSIEEVLHEIYGACSHSPPTTQQLVAGVLAAVVQLISSENGGNHAAVDKRLGQLLSYAKRRVDEDSVALHHSDEQTLLALRNKFAHGRMAFDSEQQERHFQKLVWRVITRSANNWHPRELSNFLAYCLGIRTVDVDLDEVSPLKVVALYKAAFNVLDKPSKSRALRELLMRISLDPQLREIFALARAGR